MKYKLWKDFYLFFSRTYDGSIRGRMPYTHLLQQTYSSTHYSSDEPSFIVSAASGDRKFDIVPRVADAVL